jgi:hypothetical protein
MIITRNFRIFIFFSRYLHSRCKKPIWEKVLLIISALLRGNVRMFDNSYFDNSFGFVRQFKNGSFLVHVLVHKKVEIRINRT